MSGPNRNLYWGVGPTENRGETLRKAIDPSTPHPEPSWRESLRALIQNQSQASNEDTGQSPENHHPDTDASTGNTEFASCMSHQGTVQGVDDSRRSSSVYYSYSNEGSDSNDVTGGDLQQVAVQQVAADDAPTSHDMSDSESEQLNKNQRKNARKKQNRAKRKVEKKAQRKRRQGGPDGHRGSE